MKVWVRVTAVAVVVVGAGCTAHAAAKPISGPDSIRVAGKTVPFAGAVPWSDAVGATADPRRIDIYADGDRIHGNVCGLPNERVTVTDSPTQVTINIAGYAHRQSSGLACAGVGHSPQLHQVTLPDPLDNRPLVDSSDGATHPVLNASLTPSLGQVPSGYHPQPVQWDQTSGIVTRRYRIDGNVGPPFIQLIHGTAVAINQDAPSGHVTESTTVGGSPATVWHYTDRYNNITTVQWAAGRGGLEELTAGGTPTNHLTNTQVLDLARSVR